MTSTSAGAGSPAPSVGGPWIPLTSSVAIPQLGFGTYKVPDDAAREITLRALDAGFRHVDTAEMYGNERGVGRALADAGLPRDEVFVTSKLDNPFHDPDDALAAFDRTMDDLGLERLDLFLIHWPLPGHGDFVDTWRALEQVLASGRVRAIGVSNFQEHHVQRILDEADVVPAVDQVEMHPYLTQEPLRAFLRGRGITAEAWSPLARGAVFADPVLQGLAARRSITVSQLVLAWHLHRGDVVIPKTTHPARMAENITALQVALDETEVAAISALDAGRRTGRHPDEVLVP